MEFTSFEMFAREYSTVPYYQRITADLETPVTLYLKLKQAGLNSFLFESVEGIGTLARYSFIGINPSKLIYGRGANIFVKEGEKEKSYNRNIFDLLRDEMNSVRAPETIDLPSFTGGIVGYLGFENVSLIEPVIIPPGESNVEIPDSIFGIYNTIAAFDHLKHQIILIHNVTIKNIREIKKEYDYAASLIESLKRIIRSRAISLPPFRYMDETENVLEDTEFISLVEKAKDEIKKGEVFQLVLSKLFVSEYSGNLFNLYRALRIINPSPYMYYMEFDNGPVIIGTSPEDLLKVQNGKGTILPIAGTRRRGKNREEDYMLMDELINDPKEIAEHTMLVDLARNDLGRVCIPGTVKVTEEMKIHLFSHVMHIVSRVEGELKEGADCIDALKASFPAGTVTGAPKIRAIQLINSFEKKKRGIYAGAIGYIDFRGNLDMCIAIRTLYAYKNKIYRQAGAGIVADSIPEFELKEIKNKSAVLLNALKFAEVIDENTCN